MTSETENECLAMVKNYTPEDWKGFCDSCLDKNHLQFADWMFNELGLKSFAEYMCVDFENLYKAHKDPTYGHNTLFAEAVMKLKKDMSNPFRPRKLIVFILMWIQSKKLEKMLIQFFTHLNSSPQTHDTSIGLYNTIKRNNAYYTTQNNGSNLDYSIKSINSIIESSDQRVIGKYDDKSPYQNTFITNNYSSKENTSINVNQDFSDHRSIKYHTQVIINEECVKDFNQYVYRFAVFPYLHRNTENIIKLAQFLEDHNYIKNWRPFVELFISIHVELNPQKVVWLLELKDLCFLFRAFILYEVIKPNERWAKKTADNFISLSHKKRKPEIKSSSLSSISDGHGITNLSMKQMKDWVETYGSPSTLMLYKKMHELYS